MRKAFCDLCHQEIPEKQDKPIESCILTLSMPDYQLFVYADKQAEFCRACASKLVFQACHKEFYEQS